ncbi:HD-GYP domain-containing protein [Pseudalkalibacillus caeni]|uniref:HD-GYP domain-containing protein n=1 Tax=Exobacillus caeni TaxID=2574798 RepID=A0A5R9FCI3_9BACL|nr:HD-GYP domain-containing protein [Pseudalkalibacillus caeni]TLS38264.1 HD-GYP domain-containing protein [Pseudalkalibacillus caeni]
MQKRMMISTLLNEELRTTKLFLYFFYIVTLSYDLVFYLIIPYVEGQMGIPYKGGLGFWFYVLLSGLLFVALYLIKHNRVHQVKYVYFIAFTLMNIANELLIYYDSGLEYKTGNAVEIFLVLFSPIFVNYRFFWLVSLGTIVKYLLLGGILLEPIVIIPIGLTVIFALIAFVLLNRFKGYMSAIEQSYDQQLEGIVRGVVATLELKDPYTRGHSERVAGYSQILAKEMNGLSNDELKTYNYACLLHDVGKVHIPDQILMKPSRLTDEEFEVIKTHPVVGAQAVTGIEGLESCLDVIKYHHERWDGKGYPNGLSKTNIPLLARVTAIADAYDAMTSSRSYRSAMSHEEAYKRIVEGEGTQFDPNLVKVFKKVSNSFIDYSVDYHKNAKQIDYPNFGADIKELGEVK